MSNEAIDTTTEGDAYEPPLEEETYDDGTSPEAPIPAGMYKMFGKLGSGDPDRDWGTSDNGNTQCAIDLWLPEIEKTVTTYLSFSEAAKAFSLEKLRAIGWDGSDTLPFVGIDRTEGTCEIKYESFGGKTRMKAEIKTLGRFKHQLEGSKARSFMSDLLKNAAAIPAGPVPTGPRPGARTGAPAKGPTTYPADWDKAGPAKAVDPARAGKVDL